MKLCQCSPGCTVLYGTCHCRCGETTSIPAETVRSRSWVKGVPCKYIRGHAGRHTVHQLTNIDEPNRTADCSHCGGRVTIKSRGPAGRDGQGRWRCTRTLTVQHRLSKINELKQTAWCRGCGETVPITRHAQRAKGASGAGWACNSKRKDDAFDYREANRTEIADIHRAWREANPTKVRGYQLQSTYGIMIEEYQAEVAKRGGRCDSCGQVPAGSGTNGLSLHVDKDHGAERDERGFLPIRGYLCNDCNLIARQTATPAVLAGVILYLKPSHDQLAEVIEMLLSELEGAEARAEVR